MTVKRTYGGWGVDWEHKGKRADLFATVDLRCAAHTDHTGSHPLPPHPSDIASSAAMGAEEGASWVTTATS